MERAKDAIDDAQNRLVQAIGALEDAINIAKEFYGGDEIADKLDNYRLIIEDVDNQLGKIRTGRK